MDKCRICLRRSKNTRSLYDTENEIRFYDMITYIRNMKLRMETDTPKNICLYCRKKLRAAYNFKMDIERSEMVLNENGSFKKLNFNNIHDINIKIDYKPVIPHEHDIKYHELFKYDANTTTYNNTVIKRIKEEINNVQTYQMTVKEFLNSVKMESDDDHAGQDYEIDAEYESDKYSNYSDEEITSVNKKYKKKCKKRASSRTKMESKCSLKKPIKPIYLNDVKIEHTSKIIDNVDKPKKKYKYRTKKTSVCPHCGKILGSAAMYMHILGHTGVRKYVCDLCSKSFLSEKCLSIHKQKHTAPKIFKCSLCIASFNCKPSLKSHMLVHDDERKFTCELCNKGFKRRCALKRHLLTHNFGKKSFQCELCPMTFHTNDSLKHHIRIHTGERPFKCEICSQPYSYKHDFNRHCLKKHGVFLKHRLINVMNEEVLQRERALMRELALKAQSGMTVADIPKVYDDARGALAFKQAIKAVETRQIPII